MIRPLAHSETDRLLDLWLSGTQKAHPFIDPGYWQRNYALVKEQLLPAAQTYVYVDRHRLKGFISLLEGNFVGALFVAPQFQNQKIGTKLLKYVLRRRSSASLNVYAQNQSAIDFYHRRGFKIILEQMDQSTGRAELMMSWAKGSRNGIFRRPGES